MADMNNDPECLFSSLYALLLLPWRKIYLNQTLEEPRGVGTCEAVRMLQNGRCTRNENIHEAGVTCEKPSFCKKKLLTH